MLKPTFAAAALALTSLAALPLTGCTTTVVVHEVRGGGDVPFRGQYTKVAESTFKNGRRIRVANANGAASVRVEPGKVTYDQTYVTRGEMKRVSQLYVFNPRDVHPIGNGDFEVVLSFRGMAGDTSGYSPDRNNPPARGAPDAGRRVGGRSLHHRQQRRRRDPRAAVAGHARPNTTTGPLDQAGS
jgi:hypothetical protein